MFALIPPQGTLTAGLMVHRILAILPLALLCACISSRPPRIEMPAAIERLPPGMKPLTVEQEEQVRASAAR